MKYISKKERRRRRRRKIIRRRIAAITLIIIVIGLIVGCIWYFTHKPKSSEPQQVTTAATSTSAEANNTEATNNENTSPDVTQENVISDTDTTAPVITGNENIYVAKGAILKYKSYVYVEDDTDPAPRLEIDNSDVNLSQEGTYTVIYTATDASGNSTSKTINVIVGASEEPNVDEATIYALADDILDEIITDDMSDLDKILAVYDYITTHITYVKDNNYWEYKQEAYNALTTHKDNCYANVCASKLLLERLGFQSFMIQGDLGYVNEHHYWNMVSTDGGNTWYHYDSAWWTWMNGEYPMVMLTDEQAQAISDAHGGIFNYDTSAYPATPTTPYWNPADYGYTSWYVNF